MAASGGTQTAKSFAVAWREPASQLPRLRMASMAPANREASLFGTNSDATAPAQGVPMMIKSRRRVVLPSSVSPRRNWWIQPFVMPNSDASSLSGLSPAMALA